jgi:hypothetical protein
VIKDHSEGSRKKRLPWLSLLIVTPWMIGAALGIYGWHRDRVIAQRQQTTSGTILTHEPGNHDRYGYNFSVSDKPYSGWYTPENNEPTIGQRVTVYYDPIDPNTSALDDFGELALRDLRAVPALIGGSALVIMIIVGIWWQRYKK